MNLNCTIGCISIGNAPINLAGEERRLVIHATRVLAESLFLQGLLSYVIQVTLPASNSAEARAGRNVDGLLGLYSSSCIQALVLENLLGRDDRFSTWHGYCAVVLASSEGSQRLRQGGQSCGQDKARCRTCGEQSTRRNKETITLRHLERSCRSGSDFIMMTPAASVFS